MQILEILDDLLESRHNRISALVGNSAEEHIEASLVVANIRMEIAVSHSDFVEISQHR